MDKAKRFTVLPFLVHMFIAVFAMPTNVVQVNAFEMGHEHAQPWRSKAIDLVPRLVSRGMGALLEMLRGAWDHPLRGPCLRVAASLAVVCLAQDPSTTAAAAGLIAGEVSVISGTGLKEARAAVAEIDEELADIDKRLAENASAVGAVNRQINAIADGTTKDKRSMTDDEKTKLADLRKQKTSLGDIAEALLEQKAEARKRQVRAKKDLTEAEARNEAERTAQAVDNPDAAAAARAASGAGVRVEVGKNRAEDDPKRGFKDHRDFMTAVMHAGQGRKTDPRLKPLAAAGSDEQGEYSDPHGGFLVPHGVAPGILQIEPEGDPLAGRTTPVPMQAPTVTFNARVDKDHTTSVSGGFIVTRRPETVDGTSSRMKFEQVTLTANEEFGLAFATERVLTDSPQSFVAIIQAGFRDEYAANGMNERINGLGTGERQGALQTPCKVKVSKETGQTAATIVKENIDKMAARCWRYSRAIWLANHNTRSQLKSLVQVVGTGGNAVPYFETGDGGETLDGRPIFFTEFCKTLGTEGDLILGVWSEYLDGTYESEQYAESIHVRFVSAERAFRFYRRNDGQWWWRSALTPKNGSSLSPVVTLETR